MQQTTILRVEGVSKRFGGLTVLQNVTLNLYQGEILGLIGPNGAGKTTLFNIISGALRSDNGSILYLGKDVTHLPAHLRCRLGIARTFQIPKPFSRLTVLENVTIGAYFGNNRRHTIEEAREHAIASLKLVNLGDHMGEPASNLNLTELRKLELARAISAQPQAILLDEVIAGLNQNEVRDMLEIVLNIRNNGLTILMIEHVMQAVMKVSDRVMVLHFGEFIAEGTPKELVSDQNVIAAYLGEPNDALT